MNLQSSIPHYKRTIFVIVTTFLVSILIASCGGSSTGSYGNNSNNDPDKPRDPTFANVSQIFSSNCATSGCHDSKTQQNGVDLSGYDAAINSVGSQYGKKVIQPNDAAGSPLVNKISSGDPQYGAQMPKGGAPLSSDDINLIKQWIDNGAKNN